MGHQVFSGIIRPEETYAVPGSVEDPKGDGYQLIQSKIAVGSGMFDGKGYMKGTQSTYGFIPEHHTDFIFAVIGEELGFVGAALLLGLFAIITWRAYRICRLSTDLYGKLICGRHRRRSCLPGVHEHRYDHGHHARGGSAAAVREFR